MKRSLLLSLAALLLSTSVQSADFAVDDIRIEGLQQVEPGIVFRNFPILRGDQVDDRRLNEATKDLFDSGYFDDVELLRDGDVLVVRVKERPSVALITLDGNSMIKEEQLRDALKRAGLDEGEIYRRSALDQIRLELLRVYNDAGRYTSQIDTEVEELSGNRVSLNIKIKEGREAVVKKISLIGNSVYNNEELMSLFETKLTGLFSWWTDDDKYSKEKLSSDIERLRSYYLDRGFLDFDVNSIDVSLSPNQKQVFISISVFEGEKYMVSNVQVSGDVTDFSEELNSALLLSSGDVFSRKTTVETQQKLNEIISEKGYLNAKVTAIPEKKSNRLVDVSFFVSTGKLTNVRRIEIRGNSTTADEVIRRTMPQMEGAVAVGNDIKRSRAALERTGFFRNVDLSTKRIEGVEDQVDIVVNVEEALLGQISAGVGYSSSDGLGYQAAFQQDNFMGSGTNFNASVNKSDVVTSLSLSYDDPYYTLDGVGRGFAFYVSRKNSAGADISDYDVNSIGGNVNFSYPIDDSQRLKFGIGIDQTEILLGSAPPTFINDFINSQGDKHLTYKLTSSWSKNNLNSPLFATRGNFQSINSEIATPGGDLSFGKVTYTGKLFTPFDRNETFVGVLRTRLGYATAFSNNSYPFYEQFFVGGQNSVRGYAANTIGPKQINSTGLVTNLGGTGLVSGSAELIFPFPFLDNNDSLRSLIFMDAGSVFLNNCTNIIDCNDGFNASEIRYSAGIGLTWLTPIGPLSISSATAFNNSERDALERIQFSIGGMF